MTFNVLLDHLKSCHFAIRRAGVVAPLLLGLGFLQPAAAGCLDVPGIKIPSSSLGKVAWEPRVETGRLMTADFQENLDFKSYSEEGAAHVAPIVGLWAFKYISVGNMNTLGIPDGALIDMGNTTWYADGNELTYSGGRNPNVGATCLGVWKRTGERSYVLNHIGLSWDPLATSISPPTAPAPAGPGNPGGGPGAPGGPAFIKQYITLSWDHKSYTGTFSINQLLPDGKTPALPAPIKGKITATRIDVDTNTLEP